MPPQRGMSFSLLIRLAAMGQLAILVDSHDGPTPASVAQLAEQLICNQQVVGSSPSASYVSGSDASGEHVLGVINVRAG